ncbi:MAG: YfbK domain-containing protein, partial [Devosia sp.]
IDTSGSMDEPNKLPLLKRAFGLLVDTLKPTDTVSIVVYAGSAGVVLKPTKAGERTAILSALDHLEAGGSTAGAEGIELAYRLAAESKIADGVNRVILATDGDFNVGIDTPDALKTFIKSKRDEGIFLSVLGFGRGNLDDALMQALAQNGNGNASYIDSFKEAQKVLVTEGGANMVTIAKDVKIQVEFNPAQVSEYRLIGYETRALNREDFNNDAVDAGEIGAGHSVTAIYEITPAGSGGELNDPLRYGSSASPTATSDELGFLKLRYKAPDGDTSKLIETPITQSLAVESIAAAGADQRFAAAVAAFGQKLKGSAYGETLSWDAIASLANGAKGSDEDGYRAEFVQMVHLAAALAPDRADAAPSPPSSVE